MKPIHIAKLAALTLAILTLAGCGDTAAPGELRTLDLEAAIDNAKTFDLAEIAETIDFIPLDDTQKEGLVGEITVLNESKNRFFVKDNARVSPIKIFDRTGRFLRTEGRYGRGPGEYTNILNFTTDHDTDNLYMAVSSGNSSLVVYDPSGRELTRNDSVMVNRMVIHDGSLLLLRGILINAEEMDLPPGGVMRPFLDRYSLPGLELETTIEAPDRGLSGVIRSMPNNGIRVTPGPSTVLASDGGSVLVKEALSDTLKRYRNDALEPAFVLDPGKYAIPDGALGMNPGGTGQQLRSEWRYGRRGLSFCGGLRIPRQSQDTPRVRPRRPRGLVLGHRPRRAEWIFPRRHRVPSHVRAGRAVGGLHAGARHSGRRRNPLQPRHAGPRRQPKRGLQPRDSHSHTKKIVRNAN